MDATGTSQTTWRVEEQECVMRHNTPNEVKTCGPGFTSSFTTNQSGGSYTSTLSVESIPHGLNDTRVECEDGFLMDVGMKNICIIASNYCNQLVHVH